jgi:hypothetical protein
MLSVASYASASGHGAMAMAQVWVDSEWGSRKANRHHSPRIARAIDGRSLRLRAGCGRWPKGLRVKHKHTGLPIDARSTALALFTGPSAAPTAADDLLLLAPRQVARG